MLMVVLGSRDALLRWEKWQVQILFAQDHWEEEVMLSLQVWCRLL
jgi:hypothetical protein